MYAILPLDASTIRRFESLAPFDVRHVLHDFAALNRVLAFGATLMGRPVGLAIAVQGWAKSGELNGTAPEAQSARILSLAVAQSYRRIGVARALLHAMEEAFASRGVRSMAFNYSIASEQSMQAVEALFQSAGWPPSEVTMLQCRADRALLDAPIMKDQIALPSEYEIVDWVDLPLHEREHIAERQHVSPWYPESLDPFHFEAELEIVNSLALRYRGEVVGWLITRRTSPTTMYYRSLFVRSDLARLGRGMALIGEAVRRHAAFIGSATGYGEWSTPASLPAMVRFIRRHLEPHGTTVIEQRVVRKQVPESSAAVGDEPRTVRIARTPVAQTALLSIDECARALSVVHDARSEWTAQFDTLPFHTLGASAQVDAWADVAPYHRAAARTHDVLAKRFDWLYTRLYEALSQMLNAPVAHHVDWALPGFQIWTWSRGAQLPVAPIRCELAHQYLDPGATYEKRPMAFILQLHGDIESAGLTFWDVGYDETIGLDTEESARLLDAVPQQFHRLVPGTLLVYSADAYHQRSPLQRTEERVTVEGHAVFIDGMWRVFG